MRKRRQKPWTSYTENFCYASNEKENYEKKKAKTLD